MPRAKKIDAVPKKTKLVRQVKEPEPEVVPETEVVPATPVSVDDSGSVAVSEEVMECPEAFEAPMDGDRYEEVGGEEVCRTRSGRVVRRPKRLVVTDDDCVDNFGNDQIDPEALEEDLGSDSESERSVDSDETDDSFVVGDSEEEYESDEDYESEEEEPESEEEEDTETVATEETADAE